jgi:hypothetical protein
MSFMALNLKEAGCFSSFTVENVALYMDFVAYSAAVKVPILWKNMVSRHTW